jgi:hypothetical protein
MLDAALVIADRDRLSLEDALDRVVIADAQQAEAGAEGRTLYQSVPTPDWLGGWLGLEGRNVVANADGLFRKYQKRAGDAGSMRFESAQAVDAFVEETLANAHIAIEASRSQAVLVARIGDREQAVVVERKADGGGVVISAFAPDAGQLDAKIAKVVEDARRRDAVPAILVSPLAAADADTRILISRWLPLSSDRVQPGADDLTTGRFLGNRTLFQKKGTKRGAISFLPSGRSVIKLFDKADLSTVLHETGHLMLEVMGDLAEAADAPPALKADYEKLLAWLGVADRKGIDTRHHEKLARGFEAYLMEGRAPSLELQTAFARFRSWLMTIYRSVRSLRVELDDDIRRLFDRMLATDDAIAAAEAANRFDPLFKGPVEGSPARAGIDPCISPAAPGPCRLPRSRGDRPEARWSSCRISTFSRPTMWRWRKRCPPVPPYSACTAPNVRRRAPRLPLPGPAPLTKRAVEQRHLIFARSWSVSRTTTVCRTAPPARAGIGPRESVIDRPEGRRVVYADPAFAQDGQRRVISVHVLDDPARKALSPPRAPGPPGEMFKSLPGIPPRSLLLSVRRAGRRQAPMPRGHRRQKSCGRRCLSTGTASPPRPMQSFPAR